MIVQSESDLISLPVNVNNNLKLYLNETHLISDISNIIFSSCKISDKRNIIQTCKNNYILERYMRHYEKQFKKLINKTIFFDRCIDFDNVLYRHTLELIYDDYESMIPSSYICQENRILFMYPEIYKIIAKRGNLTFLKKILEIKHVPKKFININSIICGAAVGNHLNVLDWLIENNYKVDKNNKYIAYCVAKGNHFESLKQLKKNGYRIQNNSTEVSIKKENNMDMIRWLINEMNCYNELCTKIAIQKNRLDILEILHKKSDKYNNIVCDTAIEVGNFNILKWGMARGYCVEVQSCSDRNQGGHIYMLNWLVENKFPINCIDKLSRNAAFAGNISVLNWIVDNGYYIEKPKMLSQNAAYGGQLEVLQWCKKQGFSLYKYICSIAVDKRYFEILKWCVVNYCKLSQEMVNNIIGIGDKQIIKWIFDMGYNIDASTCSSVSAIGRLSVLKMLRERGVEWNSRVCNNAAYFGHFNILKWAYDNGCTLDVDICIETVDDNHLHILKWLRKKGCVWNEKLCEACISNNNVEMIDWITSNGFKWTEKLCKLLKNETDSKDMVEWTKDNMNKIRQNMK